MGLQSYIKPLSERAAYMDEAPEEGAELLDRIDYVLSGDEEEIVVLCKSDVEKTSIDGRNLTPDEWLVSWATYLDACRLKISALPEDIDKTIRNVIKEYGISEDQLKEMFKSGGYTWEEARRHLGLMQVEKTRIDWEISSRVSDRVTDAEVIAYCNEHPKYIPARYTLKRAFIARELEVHPRKQKLEMKRKIRAGNIVWSDNYTLEEDELPEDATYITSLKQDQMCDPREVAGGFEVIKLVSKTAGYNQPPEERREECEDKIREQRFQRVLDELHNSVIEKTSIVAF